MRLIRNPFNKMEVEKITKSIVPCCEHVKQYAWYQNDHFKRVVEVPQWRDRIDRDSLMKLYNKKNPLDRNNTKNMFDWTHEDLGVENYTESIRKVLENRYSLSVEPRGTFYYPPTGYMGWHTNCDAPGERFYVSWASEDKKSFFRYYDYEKDEIVTDYDDKGLTIRQFKVSESSPYFWHCVGSECDRFSFGFLVKSSVTIDFDIYQKLLDVIEGERISDYIGELVEYNEKHNHVIIKKSENLTGTHDCDISDYGDWRLSEDDMELPLSDIKHLLTDDKLQDISFDDIAWKGMNLPLSERRSNCRCCDGERYFKCKTNYPLILCTGVPNPFDKKYRCIDGKHRIDKMISQNKSKSKCYVLEYSDIEQYLLKISKEDKIEYISQNKKYNNFIKDLINK
tara:strand:+ start:4186 stop:5373 length:1188 start_codon:yes stop_codon:yes gene_type:complete